MKKIVMILGLCATVPMQSSDGEMHKMLISVGVVAFSAAGIISLYTVLPGSDSLESYTSLKAENIRLKKQVSEQNKIIEEYNRKKYLEIK